MLTDGRLKLMLVPRQTQMSTLIALPPVSHQKLLNGELHIILKRTNLEIGERSSFFNYWIKKLFFNATLKIFCD